MSAEPAAAASTSATPAPPRIRPIPAVYFDGRSAQSRRVWIQLHGSNLLVLDRRGLLIDRQVLKRVKVQEAMRNAPQRIELGTGATLIVEEKQQLAAALAGAGLRPGFIERAQRSWFTVGCAIVAILALAWSMYLWLLPWVASMAARWMPASIEQSIFEQSWPVVETRLFQASTVPEAQQAEIRERFGQLVLALPEAPDYRIEFRAWNGGANAYALPGGLIVVTDLMVARTGRGDALMGVLAHELGHVAYRHTVRTVIQGAAVSAVFSLFTGDVTSITNVLLSTLATLKYSRDFERAADDYAIDALKAAGLPLTPLADLLQSFADNATDRAPQFNRFLSSHPVRARRIERIRAAANGK